MADYVLAMQALKEEIVDKLTPENQTKLNYVVKMGLHWLKHHSDAMSSVAADPAMTDAKTIMLPHISAIAMDAMYSGFDVPELLAAIEQVFPGMKLEPLTDTGTSAQRAPMTAQQVAAVKQLTADIEKTRL